MSLKFREILSFIFPFKKVFSVYLGFLGSFQIKICHSLVSEGKTKPRFQGWAFFLNERIPLIFLVGLPVTYQQWDFLGISPF